MTVFRDCLIVIGGGGVMFLFAQHASHAEPAFSWFFKYVIVAIAFLVITAVIGNHNPSERRDS
jgi:uncharacterized membrane protein